MSISLMNAFLILIVLSSSPDWSFHPSEDMLQHGLPDSVEILQPWDDDDALLLPLDTVAVLNRPGTGSSPVGAPLLRGEGVVLSGRTDDGWFGFEPGVAQAACTGSFRFRWICGDEDFILRGDTTDIPVVWGPEPGVPYIMVGFPVQLYSMPDTSSSILDTLPDGSAAEVLLRSGDWYRVDLSSGPLDIQLQGWVNSIDVSVSGDPDSIPAR